jgi:radical SAM protein with 4Fe4S-binding SPASM domain
MIKKELFELIEISVGDRDFNPGKISKSLESKNTLVKLHALEVLRNNYTFDLTGTVLKRIFDREKKVRIKASETLTIDPLFAFEQRAEFAGTKSNSRGRGIYLEALFSEKRKRDLSAIVKGITDSDFQYSIEDFAMLPGVENLELEQIFSGSKKKFLEEFKKLRQQYHRGKYPPQIAVAPSYRCNLDCSYCYANDLMTVFPGDMTLDRFKKVLDTLNPGNTVKRVSFIGGEPVIFPGLNPFIEELKKRNLDFYFATNGIIEPGAFKTIIKHRNLVSVTVHIEKDDFYSQDKKEKLVANVKSLGEKNINTIIRYNLLEPSNRDWNFLSKYMELLPAFAFSFAIVFPSQSGHVNYVQLKNLKDFSPKIISLIRFLKEGNAHRDFNVKVVFAKPYPPCIFNEEELKFVLKNAEYKNVCEIDKNHYTNNICINPDSSYFPCMALTHRKYRGEKILPFEELKIENKSTAGFLVKKPLMTECEECRLFLLGVCQAACYSYVES